MMYYPYQRPSQHVIDALAVRGTMVVEVENQREYDEGLFIFCGTLDSVIASLNAIRATIPEEYQAEAKCTIESSSEYDSSLVSIRVVYTRPQTDEEWEARKQDVNARLQWFAERDRAELARLKALYEA